MNRIAIRGLLLAGLAVASTLSASASVAAGTPFDGSWSVSIITEQGTCDRAYRYRVKIQDGSVSYDEPNGPAISFTGEVTPKGAVSVSLIFGDKQAAATGRLSRNTGSGRWSGKADAQNCSGRWEAQRRE
jgi:hypothetical protein